jgi:G:T/U-mismatch repair DNA glycosylase
MQGIITVHRYINKYPIAPESRKLILGTIHAHDPARFKTDFFYGNRGSLWTILHQAFPLELTQPDSLESILGFLKGRGIAMSDVIAQCGRKQLTALDADLIDIQLHDNLLPQIRQSAIEDIYFTSGLGINGAFKLFYNGLLKQRITEEIRGKRDFDLDKEFFGRTIRLHILHSPSGAANISLSKHPDYLAKWDRYKGKRAPVQAYKIDYYRETFSIAIKNAQQWLK